MMQMISTHNSSDNVNSGVPNKEGIIDRWHRCKFRIVKISGHQKQYLQFCLNAFYNDVDNIKKATLLWSCAYWGKEIISRLNDNAFVFNRMLGYNTLIFDEIDKKCDVIVYYYLIIFYDAMLLFVNISSFFMMRCYYLLTSDDAILDITSF